MTLKFSDIPIGNTLIMNVAVDTAKLSLTRTGKPYLDLQLFDGSDLISAKYWDWPHRNTPERNSVVTIEGSMGEYLGTKQLTISKLNRNLEVPISTFAPQCPVDIEEYLQRSRDLIKEIQPMFLQSLTLKIWLDHTAALRLSPGAKSIHHAHIGGALVHSVDVATKALALSKTIPESQDGLCVAGALLHDIGKLYTYKLDGVLIDYTTEGYSLDHIALGLMCLNQYRETGEGEDQERSAAALGLLQHIVASHHGKLEWGSPITPLCIEAWIVHFADMLDAKVSTITKLVKSTPVEAVWTAKEWTLENKQTFNIEYIKRVLQD